MAAQKSFDAEKMQCEIFGSRNRNIFTILGFIAETAKVLKEKGRENDFVYIIDRSIELLQGNILLKKIFLVWILIKCDEKPECAGMLKCYLELEKLLNDLVYEKSFRIHILLKIGNLYLETALYRKAIEYTLRAKKIADEINDKSVEVVCCRILGIAYLRLAEYRKAIEFHSKGLAISIKLGNRSEIANENVNLGNAYLCIEQYKKSLECYSKGLAISIEMGDRLLIATITGKLGTTYISLGQYENAIEYANKSLAISTEIGVQSEIAKSNVNLGDAYRCLGQYEKAIRYYSKALAISTEIGDQLGIANGNGSLGSTYVDMGQYQKAIEYCSKGLEISIEMGDRLLIAKINVSLGTAYHSLGQYKNAIEYANKSLAFSTEIGVQSQIASSNGILGNAYHCLGQCEKAIRSYSKALAISTEIGDQLGIANFNGSLGIAYVNMGQYQKAIEYCSKGLEISIEIGNRSGVAISNGNLGNAYFKLGQFEKAIECYCKSLKISIEIGGQSEIASGYGSLGFVYVHMGQSEKAIGHCLKGLAISTEIRDRAGIAQNTRNLGFVYHCSGQYDKAIECYNKALEISIEIGNKSGIARSNGTLAVACMSMGQYEKSIEYCSKSLAISTEIGDPSGIAISNQNLGNAHKRMGQYAKAIEYYRKSLAICTEIGDRLGMASNFGNLGDAYGCMGQYDKSIEYCSKGVAISTEIGYQSGITCHNGNLGTTYYRLGQYEKAIEHHSKCLEISFKIGDRSGIASDYGNLGNVFFLLGQYDKGIEYYSKSLAISIEIGDRRLKCFALGNIGESYFKLHRMTWQTEDASKLRKAVSFLKRSVVCSDKILCNLDVDKNRISFTSEYLIRYVTLMHCYILLKRIEAALLVTDLGKAKALHAFYEKRKKSEIVDLVDYTEETWKKIENIEEKVQTCDIEKVLQLKRKKCTVLFYAFDCDMFLNIWILNGEDRIRQKTILLEKKFVFPYLREILEQFSVDLNRDSSFYKHDFCVNPPKQKIAEESFGKMSITGKSTHGKKVPKTQNSNTAENKFSKKFQSCDNIFPHKTSDTPLKMEIMKILEHYDLAIDTSKILITPLEALFRILIKPVEKFIQGSKLIIVPDAFLFFAPFCAFQKENGCPISKDYSIQITPSLHTLYLSTKQSRPASLGFALFVGNPTVGKVMFRGEQIEPSKLANATAEAKCLARLFDAKPLVEDKAVKERILRLIHGSSIIHIAAHGDQNCGEIFLAPNRDWTYQGSFLPKEKSYLVREKDIIDIRTNALLVVLCCCHTGSGTISSEGVVGVARAFLAAGARSVLATLWPIHDEGTKLFMEYFYNEICKETSVCEALRKTMNIFQQHQNEFYRKVQVWAPFTIYGEDVKFSQNDIEEIKQKSREMSFEFEY